MVTLQLKRTERSINDSSIGSLVLEKGEPFFLIEENRKLLFIGDGETQLSNFYENRKFVSITNFVTADQILSIPASALPEGLATIAQLEQLEQDINESIGNTNSALATLNSKVDTTKLFYATCYTDASVATKTIQINVSEEEITSDYTGVSFVVRFNYANSAENPVLQVTDLENTPIISAPIYIGNQPLSGVFNWVAGDTLILTYYDNKMNMAGTSASQRIASWCSQNNATLINGGMIATGSITADKIQAGSITADQIAAGSLPASVLSQQFSAALNNLNFIEQQAASSKQVVCQCDSDEESIIKDIYLNGDAALSIPMVDDSPLYGTSLVIKFTHANKSTEGCSLRLILDGFQFPSPVNVIPPIGYYDNNNVFHGLVYNPESADADLNWVEGETRVLIYDGAHWIIQPPSGYLRRAADWCLQNNQTFIQGGSIIAGKISCAQLDAGYIDAGRISIDYWEDNGLGELINYGGLKHVKGASTSGITRGIELYGSNPDLYRIAITDGGILIDKDHGRISGWGETWQINGKNISIGNNHGSAIGTEKVQIGNTDSCESVIYCNGSFKLVGLPSSDPGEIYRIWNDNGTLKISSGS